MSCASGDTSGNVDAAAADASAIGDAAIDAPVPDAGTIVGTCEECQGNQDCEDTHQCVQTGGGKVCLERCTPEEPACDDGFTCAGVETTFCAPIDGLCCVDGDDDTYGQGIACVGEDCNDSDATINPGMDDVCNGVDDDCAPATPDGADDPMDGDDCDGDDADLCEEGVLSCVLGSLVCGDETGDNIDVCDGIDNDCNPGTLDGSGDAEVGTACDSPADPDLCLDDQKICDSAAMEIICTDLPTGAVDLCDGLDNDCDPTTPDGSGDPGVGISCDGADTDLCLEGTTFCSGGAILCDDTTGDEVDLCDGIDNDCNASTLDGSGDTSVGGTCDGSDTDLCEEGIMLCSVGVLVCTDTSGNNLDICNAVDDDCDATTPDGAHDTGVGLACDGADADLCEEGVTFCAAGGIVTCGDVTGDAADVCDAVDNDCNPLTADGSADPLVGVSCDGTDSDLCEEGATFCSGAGIVTCGDTSSDTLDVCDGADNDCNPATADGSDEVWLGSACDGGDTDLCDEGVYECSAGAQSCTDVSGDDIDVCDAVDNDCNPATADGSGDAGVGVLCDGTDSDLCDEGSTFCNGSGIVECGDTTGDTLDVCDGADNDCNPLTADGAGDSGVGVSCDGADSDLCLEGTTFCSAGSVQCDDPLSDDLDLCNGVDDDCNPATADGSADALVGVSCDGTDSDLCEEGSTVCSSGSISCNDTSGDNLELCDSADNDCNPATADGSGDAAVGVACDGSDSDLCNEGATFCGAGSVLCGDTSGDTLDTCDGLDNDCNPVTLDGADEVWLGSACDGGDSDLCNEGVFECTGASQVCTDTTGNDLELCDGADNDCNGATADGADEVWLGNACDGADTDLCDEGTFVCSGAAQVCTDTTGSTVDLCNGADDDCNPGTVDGSGDPGIGLPCDGGDTDLCTEGTTFCSGGTTQCSDTSGNNLEMCNGADDDCNPATADGSGDPGIGVLCDGTDGDLCLEGSTFCSGGTTQCSDTTGTIADMCDGVDNDCNPGTIDGSGDPMVGMACDGTDGDACLEGTFSCPAGSLSCSDTTGTIVDICDGLDNDCDGPADELGGSTCPSQHTGAVNVSSWSCSGACVIGGCDASYHDLDNLVPTGCECGPVTNWGGSCGGATALSVPYGTVSMSRTGTIVTGSDSDWHRVQFTAPGIPTEWHPTITLTDPTGTHRMDIFNGSCGGASCGSGLNTGRLSWSTDYTYPGSSPSDSVTKPTTIIIRVYRTDGLATCDPYQIVVTNPS